MFILRVSFFLFVFLFYSFGFSEPVEDTLEPLFTNFAVDLLSEDHITNVDEELNRFTSSDWSNDIARSTENWTVSEARAFLDVLTGSDIAHRSILNILQAPDYIKTIKNGHLFIFSGQLRPASQKKNASQVFFEFVHRHLDSSEIEDRMGPDWKEDISHHIRYWPTQDAEGFLATLIDSNFSLNSILNLLQAPDYLEKLRTGQINFEFFQTSAVAAESASVETSHQTNSQNIVGTQSAADIFIQRAKWYFREEFEKQKDTKYKDMSYEEAFQKKMGADWEDKIRKSTAHWTVQDAQALLDYLSKRIGEIAALNRMKSISYFKRMRNYDRFLERVTFYESYMGEDEVTYRLSRSLGGFERGDIKEIKRVVDFLEEYLGSRELIKDMMLDNLSGFSMLSGKDDAQINLNNIKDVIAYLESIGFKVKQIKSMIFKNFFGFVRATRRKLEARRQLMIQEETIGIVFTPNDINKMIEKSIYGFLLSDLEKVKLMVACLKEIGFEDDKIKEMAIENLRGLAQSDPETLLSKRQSLTQEETIGIAFKLDEIDKMIANNIEDFLRVDLTKAKVMVACLKQIGFEDDTIKKMAIQNLKGLDKGDPETLLRKRQSLRRESTIGIAFELDEIDKMIEKSIQTFLQADLEKVKEMVACLKKEIGFKDDKIKKMAIQNLQGLTKGNPETLLRKRQSLTQEETIGIAFELNEIGKMIANNIEDFLRVNLTKVKMMVACLKKEIGFKDDKIKKMAIRNLQGLAQSDPETLLRKRQSLTQEETIGITFELDEIDKMIEGNIQGFLRADLEKAKVMVTYLKIKSTGFGFEDNTIKKMAIENLQGLAKGDPETLKSKKESLTKIEKIGIALTSDEINKMIEKNIEGFLQADLKKVKEMVTYLKEIGVANNKIKKMVIQNLISFSTIKSSELRGMIESFKNEPQLRRAKTETLMKKIREMITDQNLINFFYNNFDTNLKALTCPYALSN